MNERAVKNIGMNSLRLLEYEKVLVLVKEYCISEYSKEKLLSIKPLTEREKIERVFSEMREALFVLSNGVQLSLKSVHDTKDLLSRSLIENNYLDPDEILRIRENIVTFSMLKRRLSPFARDIPLVTRKLAEVRIPVSLRERIDAILDEHGNVREDATSRLAEILQKLRNIREEIERTLEGYFQSQETKGIFQERHITLKDDRYVIPVKHNFKGRIPGVIHAQSGSGETVFLEPFTITSKNNEMKLLQKERELELRRILVSLTSEIGKHRQELLEIQEKLAEFDILHAKCQFLKDFSCTIPEFSDIREIRLTDARHPLIQGKVVPIDFSIDSRVVGVVITGPNTGGKTVTLKTIGLFVQLAQAGFPVPAKELKTYIFKEVCADIGDEQSIEQSLSTFSGHIRNIKRIVDEAEENSLILLDELGAGTDPIEGGALGTAILDHLVSRNVLTIVTTHFSTVKMYALSNEKVSVASVQFDSETCRPTYTLIMGIPGRSNALDIARHLGLKGAILKNSLAYLSEKDRSIDRIFRNLGKMEIGLSRREKTLKGEEKKLNDLIERYRKKLAEVGEKERFIRAEYRSELEDLLASYSSRLEKRIQEIRTEGPSRERIKGAREERERVEREFKDYVNSRAVSENEEAPPKLRPISIGDSVRVQSDYGAPLKGEVIDKRGSTLIVQAGIFRITVDERGVELEDTGSDETRKGWDYELSNPPVEQYECDIRGMRYAEAMDEVVKFLDNAVLKNMSKVSIVHGMGTGALRQGVWELLRKSSVVEHFEYAHPDQGGYGCTIVTLKA